MSEFYYRHIAPIICRIVGHKWNGFADFLEIARLAYGVSIAEEKAANGDLRYIGKEGRSMFIVPVAVNY